MNRQLIYFSGFLLSSISLLAGDAPAAAEGWNYFEFFGDFLRFISLGRDFGGFGAITGDFTLFIGG